MTAIDEIIGRIDDALFSRLVVEQTDLRALPLPTAPRQAVRLTDVEVDAIAHAVAQSFLGGGGNDVDRWDVELSRAIEIAVLAKNGLGGSNG